MWRRIFKRKQGEKGFPVLAEKEFCEIIDCLPNPGQGWYRIYTCDARIPFAPEEVYFGEGEKLALVRVSLEGYRERRLSDDCLKNIRQILSFFDAREADVILRVAYDFEGKGAEREPDIFSQVLEHIRQLAPVVKEFEDRILVFQGLLVGSWGEMHNSKFLSERRLRNLEEAFREGGNDKVWLSLRRPVYLRMLAGEAGPAGRRALFDDALGASETDMGTFGWKKREETFWTDAWIREDELAFMENICVKAPFGGEAVLPVEGYGMSPMETLETLGRMHLSYLNSEHDERLLDRWKGKKVRCKGIWDGASLYDYIGAHMGYRFCLRRVSFTETGENRMRLSVEIENTGFGNLLQEAQAELVWISETGERHRQLLDWDARRWHSGKRVTCTAQVQIQSGRLYLGLSRKWDGSRILFANESEWGMVDILHV